jgi:hypothetical protein
MKLAELARTIVAQGLLITGRDVVQKYRRGKGMTLEVGASKPALAADEPRGFRARIAHYGLQAIHYTPQASVSVASHLAVERQNSGQGVPSAS